MADDRSSSGATPYSTGGGGTVLEHRYGALLLAHLLTGDPLPALGDDATPVRVRFQARAESPVDDLLVAGRTADGSERLLSVGVRRAPGFTKSERESLRLVASYLRVVTDHWAAVQEGQWRLALAVASPTTAATQVRQLCAIARAASGDAAFRQDVARPRRTNEGVRRRLGHLDALVAAATAEGAIEGITASEATWRLLSTLRVVEVRLEGADESDRTAAVARLRPVTREATSAAADQLFSRLAELVGTYAPTGSDVTETVLRRDLSGVALARSTLCPQAWRVLDRLAEQLSQRIHFHLVEADAELELQRPEAREELASAVRLAGTQPAALVVYGDPDVGKSALTLRVAQELAEEGAAVTALSLRDLPPSMLELEDALDGSLPDVFGATAVGPARLVVIDGAESAVEGRGQLLGELATAALGSGLGVVAVTRGDAKGAVVDALQNAAVYTGVDQAVGQQEVPRLTPAETGEVVATFTSLSALERDPRAALLLGRVGLIELVLRADASRDLTRGPISEADLFAVIWRRLVRQNEDAGLRGPSPDSREHALTSLARRQLLPTSTPLGGIEALASLRSDGLLLPLSGTSAWNAGDEFASDLIRDFSVARLLLIEGWQVLDEAGAPRWTVRAVRLACQAKLANAAGEVEAAREELNSVFTDLASRHGERWTELPLEALLTLGDAATALQTAWPGLLANDRQGLETLLRLALQRYSHAGIGDVLVLEPLVDACFCGDDDLGQLDRYSRRGTGSQIRDLVLVWLRGLAFADTGPNSARQRVRDRLLETESERPDEFAVEAIAMLGSDLDPGGKAILRRLAEQFPECLAPAVESVGPVVSLSTHRPELLLDLGRAYYIEEPATDEEGFGWSPLDEGIRRHHSPLGPGAPMAAWYFGPFFRLLNVRPVETLAFINQMLDHAAALRVRELAELGGEAAQAGASPPGLDLDLPGVGVRRCIGDPHVWFWYRGSSVGPYPCMSALLAVERFADHLVDTLKLPMGGVVELLVRDCNNLAMPGLVVGLLVRHLDQAGDLLDRWLVRPEVWRLEFSRTVSEATIHVQGPDAAEVVGRDRRSANFRDVAAQMTIGALLQGNQERLTTLRRVGDDLLEKAEEVFAGASEEEMGGVRGWAATLDPANYRAVRTEDGEVAIQFEPPDDLAATLAPSLASFTRTNEALRLQMTYGTPEDRVAPVESLTEDLAIARTLVEDPPQWGPLDFLEPVAAVAAAAVVAAADQRVEISDEDLHWAADVLIEAARRPQLDEMSYEGSMYQLAADRSAAVALPALLLPAFDHLELDGDAVEEGLRSSATSLFDEVRAAFVSGARRVWRSPCSVIAGTGRCRHEVLWAAAQEGLRDCRFGTQWDRAGRRVIDPLDPPYETTLPEVETERLRLNQLLPPLAAAGEAILSASCVAEAARPLFEVLLDAHQGASDHWATKGYGDYGPGGNPRRPSIPRVLAEFAVAGEPQPLADHVRAFTSNPRALDHFLRELGLQFSYDPTFRQHLSIVWRHVMMAALNAVDDGANILDGDHWSDSAIAGLIPTPQLDIGDSDPSTTFEKAEHDWLDPDEIGDLVARWIPLARQEPRSVSAIARLARCASIEWQATTGLAWAEDAINGQYEAVASRTWFLVDWLEAVKTSGELPPDGTARWRRIVDGLAAHGDSAAVRLQQSEE